MDVGRIASYAGATGLIAVLLCCLLRRDWPKHPRAAAVVVVLVVLGYFIALWDRFGVPFSDMGLVLYIPVRILRGELLYDEVFWIHGPLEPYLHAILYGIFGVHSAVLQSMAVLGNGVVAALVFCIALRWQDAKEALLSALLVVALCSTAPYMAFPYTFSSMYALLFVLALLLACRNYIETNGTRELLFMAFFTALAGLSKQSYGCYAAVAVGLWLLLDRRSIVNPAKSESVVEQSSWPAFARFGTATGIMTLLPYGYFLVMSDHAILWRNIIPLFHARNFTRLYPTELLHDLSRLSSMSLAGAGIVVVQHWILLGGLVLGGLRYWQHRNNTDSQHRMFRVLYVVAVFSLLTYQHFFHALFILPLWILILGTCLSSSVAEPQRQRLSLSRMAVLGFVVLLLFVRMRQDGRKETMLASDQVHVLDHAVTGEPIRAMALAIQLRAGPDDGLVIAAHPELLYLLTGLHTPLRYSSMHIPGFVQEQDEEEVLQRMEESQPRFVVMPSQPIVPSDFMAKSGREKLWKHNSLSGDESLQFGLHYCKAFGDYVRSHYFIAAEAPGLLLYQRK